MISQLGLRTARVSTIDDLRSGSASVGLQVAGIVGFAALTALGAQFRLYLWEVPFTLQTLAVYGSGLYLGWRNGLLAQGLYLLVGLFFARVCRRRLRPSLSVRGYFSWLSSGISAIRSTSWLCFQALERAHWYSAFDDRRLAGSLHIGSHLAALRGRSCYLVRVH